MKSQKDGEGLHDDLWNRLSRDFDSVQDDSGVKLMIPGGANPFIASSGRLGGRPTTDVSGELHGKSEKPGSSSLGIVRLLKNDSMERYPVTKSFSGSNVSRDFLLDEIFGYKRTSAHPPLSASRTTLREPVAPTMSIIAPPITSRLTSVEDELDRLGRNVKTVRNLSPLALRSSSPKRERWTSTNGSKEGPHMLLSTLSRSESLRDFQEDALRDVVVGMKTELENLRASLQVAEKAKVMAEAGARRLYEELEGMKWQRWQARAQQTSTAGENETLRRTLAEREDIIRQLRREVALMQTHPARVDTRLIEVAPTTDKLEETTRQKIVHLESVVSQLQLELEIQRGKNKDLQDQIDALICSSEDVAPTTTLWTQFNNSSPCPLPITAPFSSHIPGGTADSKFSQRNFFSEWVTPSGGGALHSPPHRRKGRIQENNPSLFHPVVQEKERPIQQQHHHPIPSYCSPPSKPDLQQPSLGLSSSLPPQSPSFFPPFPPPTTSHTVMIQGEGELHPGISSPLTEKCPRGRSSSPLVDGRTAKHLRQLARMNAASQPLTQFPSHRDETFNGMITTSYQENLSRPTPTFPTHRSEVQFTKYNNLRKNSDVAFRSANGDEPVDDSEPIVLALGRNGHPTTIPRRAFPEDDSDMQLTPQLSLHTSERRAIVPDKSFSWIEEQSLPNNNALQEQSAIYAKRNEAGSPPSFGSPSTDNEERRSVDGKKEAAPDNWKSNVSAETNKSKKGSLNSDELGPAELAAREATRAVHSSSSSSARYLPPSPPAAFSSPSSFQSFREKEGPLSGQETRKRPEEHRAKKENVRREEEDESLPIVERNVTIERWSVGALALPPVSSTRDFSNG